jgi:hypothetical protein
LKTALLGMGSRRSATTYIMKRKEKDRKIHIGGCVVIRFYYTFWA